MKKTMNIINKKIKIKDLVKGFENTEEKGLIAYGGKLIIRPPYQREFIYNDKQQVEVIKTVLKQRPLNVMYWGSNQDGTFEVIDGQQRILSIIKFVNGDFSVPDEEGNPRTFTGESGSLFRDKINNYELDVYVCEGDAEEKLEWFQTINIAGAILTPQEMRNATYNGKFITEARKYFSKNSKGYRMFKLYLAGKPERQDWLEKTLKWVSKYSCDMTIEQFLSKYRNESADSFIEEIEKIGKWVRETFVSEDSHYCNEMKLVEWGELYYINNKDTCFGKDDARMLRDEVEKLQMDSDVTDKKGIYKYLITNDIKYLQIRLFTSNDARTVYSKQGGLCNNKECPNKDKKFKFEEMEADHITPWSEGGKTTIDNLQMLCKNCNRRKSNN